MCYVPCSAFLHIPYDTTTPCRLTPYGSGAVFFILQAMEDHAEFEMQTYLSTLAFVLINALASRLAAIPVAGAYFAFALLPT